MHQRVREWIGTVARIVVSLMLAAVFPLWAVFIDRHRRVIP